MRIEVDNAIIKIPNFEPIEFDCKCGCGFNNIQGRFVWTLQQARTEAQIPFHITSGCRCPEWNKEVGGSLSSDHLKGEAADVFVNTSRNRFRVINAAISAGIKRIGIGKTFVHLGYNWNNTQEVLWLY